MTDNQKPYALITGAGQGLGLAFARELASRGIPVLLVALKGEGLPDTCAALTKEFGVDAQYFEGDLTSGETIEALCDWATSGFNVNILINNVGLGNSGAFREIKLKILDTMVLLNVRATTLITHRMLPGLKKNTPAFVLNISSMASFSPFGYKSVYAASKVYIEYFSKGLHRELKRENIFVSTAHPGPMNTNPEVAERIKNQNFIGRMGVKNPDEVAKVALDKMFRKHRFILVGTANAMQWLLMKTIPGRLVISLVTKGVKKEIDKGNSPAA